MTEQRTVCHTPTPDKKPTRIPTWKYDLVRRAILATVPAKAPGVAAKDLPALVRKQLAAGEIESLGSVNWHTTTVKLNMEVEGELQRVPGLKPQHVVRT